MKKTYEILRIVLPILALVLGGIKVAGIPVERDTFLRIGLPVWVMPVFGVLQAVFGAAIFFPVLQGVGLWSSMAFLVLASVLMAAHGMPRALVPIAGVATLLVFARARWLVLHKDPS
jgi:ABC-type branched-subunit amino acid transport system permease subunit